MWEIDSDEYRGHLKAWAERENRRGAVSFQALKLEAMTLYTYTCCIYQHRYTYVIYT